MKIVLRLIGLSGLLILLGYLLFVYPDGKRMVNNLVEKYWVGGIDKTQAEFNAQILVEQINKYRADKKLSFLKENEALKKSAESRLAVIISSDDLDGNKTGVTVENALRNNGYEYQIVGSMYALDLSDPGKLIEEWSKNDESTKALSEKSFTEIGVATIKNQNGWQIVVVMARPARVTKTNTVQTSWGGPELWEAVNKRRQENGVNPLQKKDELCTIASIRLNQLIELGKLDGHAGFEPVLSREDLKWIREKYNLSEFLVSGYSTPQKAVEAWEHTLGHRDLVAGGQYVWGCVYAQNTFGVAITAY